MMEKYALDSDFLESYLNCFVIKTYFTKQENLSVISDAALFNSCVHLNSSALKLANCSDRRDSVYAFISDNADCFNKYKSTALNNCKDELYSAHGASLHFEKDLSRVSASELNFWTMMRTESEDKLENCINKHL